MAAIPAIPVFANVGAFSSVIPPSAKTGQGQSLLIRSNALTPIGVPEEGLAEAKMDETKMASRLAEAGGTAQGFGAAALMIQPGRSFRHRWITFASVRREK